MTDDDLRNLAADSMAQGFILEILLADYLKKFGEDRFAVAETILNAAQKTDQLPTTTFEAAELLSDVVVRMRTCLDQYVGRALLRREASATGRNADPSGK